MTYLMSTSTLAAGCDVRASGGRRRARARVWTCVCTWQAAARKSNLPAKPRLAARPIGSAGGPPCRPIGTLGIDVNAKFRKAASDGVWGGRGAPAACPSVSAVRSVPRWSRSGVRSSVRCYSCNFCCSVRCCF